MLFTALQKASQARCPPGEAFGELEPHPEDRAKNTPLTNKTKRKFIRASGHVGHN